MIETLAVALPDGVTLSCRAAGDEAAPVLMFLHGFPEAAFVWDETLLHFASCYRCIAPNLRGFAASSSPTEVEAYRAKHLAADIAALVAHVGGSLEALVAHDWGGAVAWMLAAQRPQLMKRLVIINSPHPAVFLRELQTSKPQQAASAYMNFLCRPDAERLLAENDYARLWPWFTAMDAAGEARPGSGWLTEPVRDRYRAVWGRGLTGGCNYYRASPLRPPLAAPDPVLTLQLPPETLIVRVPTDVIWGEDDVALLPTLLNGLDAFVADLRVVRVPRASHWIIHERPEVVAAEIERAIAR